MSRTKNKPLPITLCVITANSGKRIKDVVLKHKKYVSEVLVVVQKSEDDTLARAREVADCVIERRNKGTSDPDRNWLFDLASNPWVLYLDDDEFISPKLAKNLKKLIESNVDVFWLQRDNFVNNKDISAILGKDYQARLFRKGSLRFPDEIHTYPTLANEAISAYVDYPIIHKRGLEQLKKSNRARNCVASREQIGNQEKFIADVERYLGSL